MREVGLLSGSVALAACSNTVAEDQAMVGATAATNEDGTQPSSLSSTHTTHGHDNEVKSTEDEDGSAGAQKGARGQGL